MTRLLILVNRGLYGALGLIALAGAAAWISTWAAGDAEPMAKPLPAFTLTPLAEHSILDFPDRNIFDPSGAPWRGKTTLPSKTSSQLPPAKGIIKLPGIEGVLTENGLVRPGQMLPQGRLKSVVSGGYVVSAPGGEVTTPLDPDRQARIKTVLAPPPLKPASPGTVK